MTKLIHKSFLLGKDNEPDGRQDALAINAAAALYAVADGVSNSFHPELVARTLCSLFTGLNPAEIATEDWSTYSEQTLLPAIWQQWNDSVAAHMASLSGRLLRHEQYNLERWRMGASTFCGVHVDPEANMLRYFIIGDSTLFVHKVDGSVVELCSSPQIHTEAGNLAIDYSNVTSAVTSSNQLAGEWLIGEMALDEVSCIALMTDGMAKWYQKELQTEGNPFEYLWGIDTPEDFAIVATRERAAGEMDDDLATILIRIEAAEEQAEAPEEAEEQAPQAAPEPEEAEEAPEEAEEQAPQAAPEPEEAEKAPEETEDQAPQAAPEPEQAEEAPEEAEEQVPQPAPEPEEAPEDPQEELPDESWDLDAVMQRNTPVDSWSPMSVEPEAEEQSAPAQEKDSIFDRIKKKLNL